MARKAKGSGTKKGKSEKSKTQAEKRKHIKGWSDEKVQTVWAGFDKGEYDLGEDDIKILKAELKRRGIGDDKKKEEGRRQKEEGGDEGEEEEEQVPLGYIKLYPDTPERNEFYKKRYENARIAWSKTKLTKKGESWFIVAKSGAEFGYDVHLFFTSDGSVHGTCTCADFTQRGVRRSFPCKHIFMVLVDQKLTPKWAD